MRVGIGITVRDQHVQEEATTVRISFTVTSVPLWNPLKLYTTYCSVSFHCHCEMILEEHVKGNSILSYHVLCTQAKSRPFRKMAYLTIHRRLQYEATAFWAKTTVRTAPILSAAAARRTLTTFTEVAAFLTQVGLRDFECALSLFLSRCVKLNPSFSI